MDVWGYLKPTSILHICQEVAYMHSSKLGFGFDRLLEIGAAWVLSRVKVEIERLPIWRERITVRTWHKRQSGLFALRDYIFYDQQGEPIIRVTTSWLIINTKTRRITRVDRVFSADEPFKLVSYPHDAIEAEAEKVNELSDGITLGSHRVVYSDMDLNHHVNNAKYMEWACDNSPQQMLSNRFLSHFCLNFNHEATYNEEVTLQSSQDTEDKFIIAGCVSGRSIFTAQLQYGERG